MKDNKLFIFLIIAGVIFFFYTNNKEVFHKAFNENFHNQEVSLKHNQEVSLKKGGKGPGGGIIFYIEGGKAWEMSEWLGKANWEEAKRICRTYRGGGFNDWYLPNKDELKWIYKNLIETDKLEDDHWLWKENWHWSSTADFNNEGFAWLQLADSGVQASDYTHEAGDVRAVRAFNISNANKEK